MGSNCRVQRQGSFFSDIVGIVKWTDGLKFVFFYYQPCLANPVWLEFAAEAKQWRY